MDPERPAASRIAGQTSSDSGTLFGFTAMWRTFKFGNPILPKLAALDVSGRDVHAGSSGLRPYLRLADGDGHR